MPQRLFGHLAFGDVVGDDAQRSSAAIGDRTGIDLYVDQRAVLAPVLSLPDKAASILEDMLDVAVDGFAVVGYDVVDRHPRERIGRVGERAVQGGVGLDDSLGLCVHEEDVLCCLLDHAAVELLALAQPLLGLPAFGDVALVHHHAPHARIIKQVVDEELGAAPGAVFVRHRELEGRMKAGLGPESGEDIFRLLEDVRAHVGEDVLAHQLIGAVTRYLLDRRADVAHGALGVDHRDHIRRVLHQGTKALLALAQLLLDLLALCDVAHYLRETPQVALLVFQSRDEHARPEPRAVLADPQAILPVVILRGRRAQFLLEVAALEVLLGVKHRRVLDDYLLFPVAGDALRPRVPAGDTPLGIEHEDGVVLYPFDQQTEAFFAPTQALLMGQGLSGALLCPTPGDAQRLSERADHQPLHRK